MNLIAEIYDVFLNKTPRKELLKDPRELNDKEWTELQNFIGGHQKVLTWSANISIMDCVCVFIDGKKELGV